MSGNENLDDRQLMLRDTARQISDSFREGAAQADRDRRPPVENVRLLAEQGFTGTFIPKAYGGLGLGILESTLIIEQVARNCANTAMLMSMTDGATPRAILHLGTEEQKRRYLPRFVSGELFAAWSMSEAKAGSDLGAITTRAARDGDSYRLTGSKMWCSCAQVADLFLVLLMKILKPGGREYVHHLVGDNGSGHDLTDRMVELLVCPPLARRTLRQHCTDGLEEANIVPNPDRLGVRHR